MITVRVSTNPIPHRGEFHGDAGTYIALACFQQVHERAHPRVPFWQFQRRWKSRNGRIDSV